LTELAGPWDERLSPSGDDDGEYMCRLVRRSERVKFIPEGKSYYRVGNAGTLSWRRKSDKALSSFFWSTVLCIEHLRALEDSERTRRACVKYLQDKVTVFYPEKPDIVEEARELARSLGGELILPMQSLKFMLIRKIFGWKIAKEIKMGSHIAKLGVRRNWDKVLYKLSIS
jgi:hypothetical protein